MQNVLRGLVCTDSFFPTLVPQHLNPSKPYFFLSLRVTTAQDLKIESTWARSERPGLFGSKRFWILNSQLLLQCHICLQSYHDPLNNDNGLTSETYVKNS
ncbi:hypothetical protein LEMLEM_LOCUS8000 [Lemmus lemmus]